MTLNFQNTNIFYSAKGTGKPLVLLHGFLESSAIWEPFLEALARERMVITIDLPGHGRTGTLGEVHTMELMAKVVKAVLEKLSVEKATFAGHSMGGYVCLSFAEQFPGAIHNLILMNSTPEADTEERKTNRERAIKLIQKNKSAFIGMAISNLLPRESNRKYEKELQAIRNEALQFPEEGIIASIKGMKIRTDKIEVLKKFRNRKVIIAGANDPVLDWKRIEKVAFHCNCELISTKNGHLSFLEDTTQIREILHFID